MSQYLSFDLKKKDDPEISISLGYFCTTPARQISGIGAFPYTEEDTALDDNIFSSYLEDIKEERDKYKEYLAEYIKKKEEVNQFILKCSSKEVAQLFVEQIENINNSIIDIEEEIDDWNYRVDKLEFILSVWNDNKDKWNLYYHNC